MVTVSDIVSSINDSSLGTVSNPLPEFPDATLAEIIMNHVIVSERNLEVDTGRKIQRRLAIMEKHLSWTRGIIDELTDASASIELQGKLSQIGRNMARRLECLLDRFEKAMLSESSYRRCRLSRSIRVQIARLAMFGMLSENSQLIERTKTLFGWTIENSSPADNWIHVSNIRMRLASIHQLESFAEQKDEAAKIVFSRRILNGLADALASLSIDFTSRNP